MRIIGRSQEIKDLEALYSNGRPEFVVVYGRRRVGKTFLINELFKNRTAFSHTALSPVEISGNELMKMQLQHFTHSLIRQGANVESVPSNWLDAFFLLEQYLEAKADGKRMLVFIDELPWLDTPRSGFVTAFEAFWNGWCAKREDIMLVVCGSAVAWVSDRLLNNKGGLFNRITKEIKLRPFILRESEEFLKSRNIIMDRYDIMQSYMIFGGIPYYMDFFSKGLSLAQNVDKLVFNKNGTLASEFDRLLSSVFTHPGYAIKVIQALSEKRTGYTREELLKKTGIGDGGAFTRLLRSLAECDFISRFRYFGEKEKNTRYRLCDNFVLFYMQFLHKKTTTDPDFWQHSQNSPSIIAWRGLSFENMCFSHIGQIKNALGISGVLTETYSWKNAENQIDMIIDRADRIINLCECKFSIDEFAISKEYDRKLRNRQAAFIEEAAGRKSTMMTLITTFGLKENEYSSRFQNIITGDDLFQ